MGMVTVPSIVVCCEWAVKMLLICKVFRTVPSTYLVLSKWPHPKESLKKGLGVEKNKSWKGRENHYLYLKIHSGSKFYGNSCWNSDWHCVKPMGYLGRSESFTILNVTAHENVMSLYLVFSSSLIRNKVSQFST